ncbi:uncharacterized protein TNCV_2449881 [Trichonephila clavipes]|uniref:Integrase p58-like C-terminal domain-containing protein n=1 Tax=Trichonephila clavipes TaxID=2585209 RepID=A0A8X6V0F4_TRICX|nr:uncharacterized protein TNCV_2449881 [Trichonephila clavipes]
MGIQKRHISSYSAHVNGRVEKPNQSLANILASISQNTNDWDDQLPHTMLALNSAIHEATYTSPFFLEHGRDIRLSYTYEKNSDTPQNKYEYVEKLLPSLEHTFNKVLNNLKDQEASHVELSTRATKQHHYDYKIGSLCFIKTPNIKSNLSPKLRPKFEGPYRVIERFSNVNYRVQHVEQLRKRFNTHVNRMIPFIKRFSYLHLKNLDDLQPDETEVKGIVPSPRYNLRARAEEEFLGVPLTPPKRVTHFPRLEEGNVPINTSWYGMFLGISRVLGESWTARRYHSADSRPIRKADCVAKKNPLQNTEFQSDANLEAADRRAPNNSKNWQWMKRIPLTKNHRRLRLQWAHEHGTWQADWHQVVLSNESRFNVWDHDGRFRVTHYAGERCLPECIIKRHSGLKPGVMIWGAISYHGPFNLLRIEGNLNSNKFAQTRGTPNSPSQMIPDMLDWRQIWGSGKRRKDINTKAYHTITPTVGAVCRCKAKAGLRRLPRGLHTRTRLSSLLRLNLDSSLKTTWFHSAAVQFPRAWHHSKRRRRWVRDKGSTGNGRRDPKCPSARHLRMVREDTEDPSEGAICAWMAADEAVDCTRTSLTMWWSSRRLVYRGCPEPGLRVNDISRIHWFQHLLTMQ